MMKMKLLVLFLASFFLVINGKIEVNITPKNTKFYKVGSDLTVQCKAKPDTGAVPPITWFESDDRNYTNGDLIGRVSITEDIKGSQTTLTMTIRNLTTSDIYDKSTNKFVCRAKLSETQTDAHAVFIYIIPVSSVPVFGDDTHTVQAEKDGQQRLLCSISAQLVPPMQRLKALWTRTLGTSSPQLGDNVKFIPVSSNDSYVESELLIKGVGMSNGGSYYCCALVEMTRGRTTVENPEYCKTYMVDVTYKEVPDLKDSELVVMAGKSTQFDCTVNASPLPKISWMKAGKPIDASSDRRYSFSNGSTSKPAKRVLTISDVTYVDRAVFECVVNFNNQSTFTKQFTLRVRDPLGALWPAIGIVAEAVVLAVIIFLFEACKSVKKPKGENRGEKSPLVTDAPVSYTKGDEGVSTSNNLA